MCDQKDCVWNAGNSVHHDHNRDKCEHPHPNIQRYAMLDGKTGIKNEMTLCNSKSYAK